MPLLDHALACAALGIPVMPLFEPGQGGSCSCGSPQCRTPGKHPRNRNGLKAASADPDVVRTWWTTWPRANIGGRTGAVFDVCDVDNADGCVVLPPSLHAGGENYRFIRDCE